MKTEKRQKVIVVCGPTATGKSDFAVALAKKINGEIISADSRQVYRGLDIGSGKITKREMKGIPHHLIDVASPKRIFSVVRYQALTTKAIDAITMRGKVPIIVGGTGFYIDAIICSTIFPTVKHDAALRKKLEKETLVLLCLQLAKLDPRRYALVDTKNKVRLIRAIEIATALGQVPELQKNNLYNIEWHYLDFPDDVLKSRIHTRLLKRMKSGMVQEVQQLHEQGMSWKRLESLGLEYRYVSFYLQKKMTKALMLEELERASWQYAKRQRTWFKKYGK